MLSLLSSEVTNSVHNLLSSEVINSLARPNPSTRATLQVTTSSIKGMAQQDSLAFREATEVMATVMASHRTTTSATLVLVTTPNKVAMLASRVSAASVTAKMDSEVKLDSEDKLDSEARVSTTRAALAALKDTQPASMEDTEVISEEINAETSEETTEDTKEVSLAKTSEETTEDSKEDYKEDSLARTSEETLEDTKKDVSVETTMRLLDNRTGCSEELLS